MTEKLSVRMKTLVSDVSDTDLKHRGMFVLDLATALAEMAERIEAMETPGEPDKPAKPDKPRGSRAPK